MGVTVVNSVGVRHVIFTCCIRFAGSDQSQISGGFIDLVVSSVEIERVSYIIVSGRPNIGVVSFPQPYKL